MVEEDEHLYLTLTLPLWLIFKNDLLIINKANSDNL